MDGKTHISSLAASLIEGLRVTPLRAGEKRNRILEAALELMSRYGYRKTTVDEIADRAGVAKGTVYLYFRDKREILMNIIREKISEVVSKVMEEIAGEPDVPSRMIRAITSVLNYHRSDLMLNRILSQSPEILGPVFMDTVDQIEQIFQTFITALIRMGIEEGSFDPELDAEMTGAILFRLNQATILRIKTGDDVDIERFVNALRRLVLTGISKRRQ